MKTLIKILLLYALALFCSAAFTLLFTQQSRAIAFFKNTVFWFGPLAFIFAGVVLGVLVLLFSKKANRLKFIFVSAMTGCVLFCLLIASSRFYDWYRSRYSMNIEANESFMNSSSSYPQQEELAFKMLTDKYEQPNNIILTGKSIRKYDSIVNNVTTKAYEVEFEYFKRNIKGYYKSKCIIIGDQGHFQYFDRLLNYAEQHSADSSYNEGLKKILDDSERLSLDSTSKATILNKIKSK